MLVYVCNQFSINLLNCKEGGGYTWKNSFAEYANVSRSSAINFMKRMRIMYDIDQQRCLYGKIPVAVVKDFFNQEVKKRN